MYRYNVMYKFLEMYCFFCHYFHYFHYFRSSWYPVRGSQEAIRGFSNFMFAGTWYGAKGAGYKGIFDFMFAGTWYGIIYFYVCWDLEIVGTHFDQKQKNNTRF